MPPRPTRVIVRESQLPRTRAITVESVVCIMPSTMEPCDDNIPHWLSTEQSEIPVTEISSLLRSIGPSIWDNKKQVLEML